MSKSFIRIASMFRFLIPDNLNGYNSEKPKIIMRLAFAGLACAGHIVYVSSTFENEKIIIDKKYTLDRYGHTEFMVVSKDGRHFNVNNSLWFNKWDSIEDWVKIKENNSYYVKYYGVRLPFLGFFPNIVNTKGVNMDNSWPSPNIVNTKEVNMDNS
jgi:hypothetical protein